jgi:hypothetical protein
MSKLKEIGAVLLAFVLMNGFTLRLCTGMAAIAVVGLIMFLAATFHFMALVLLWGIVLAVVACVALLVGTVIWGLIDS